MLEDRLPALKQELIEYGSLVENMIEKAIQGLMRKDRVMLSNVIDRDEPRANALEIELDEHCTTLVAQYQPIAKDLRTVLMILKMNSDLERMGDHAVNIAESVMFLVERTPVKPLLDIPRMAEGVVSRVSDSLRSFVNENAKLARSVCQRDDVIDSLARQVLHELVTYMSADPSTIERCTPPAGHSRELRAHSRPFNQHRGRCHLHGRRPCNKTPQRRRAACDVNQDLTRS